MYYVFKLLFILLANEGNYSQNSQPTQMEVEPPQGPPTEAQNHPPPPPQASGARGGGRSTTSKILHWLFFFFIDFKNVLSHKR